MLARPYRLPARYKLSHPKTFYSPLFLLKYASSPVSHSRCSVVISKAVDKRSTKRNELRRIVLSCVQTKLKSPSKPVDLLFILKKDAVTATKGQLEQLVLESLEKIVL